MEYTEEIRENALLSEFAYIKFENYTNYEGHIYTNIEELLNSSDTKEMKLFIDSSESGVADDRKEAMKDLLNDYTIVDFKNSPTTGTPDDGLTRISDMQAVLLEEKGSGDKVIAFRGTEPTKLDDFVVDKAMSDGAVTNQMIDAMTWVEALRIKV